VSIVNKSAPALPHIEVIFQSSIGKKKNTEKMLAVNDDL